MEKLRLNDLFAEKDPIIVNGVPIKFVYRFIEQTKDHMVAESVGLLENDKYRPYNNIKKTKLYGITNVNRIVVKIGVNE